MEEKLLTQREVAKLLQVSVSTVQALRKSGEFPVGIRISKVAKWSPGAIKEWARERGMK